MSTNQKTAKLLEELEAVASKLDIKLRYEVTKARGGLCTVDGEKLFILDRKSSKEYKLLILARAIKEFDLSDIYLSPKLREFLYEEI
ncbi:conserved hypothetical protein [Denitrovibrio acetiphilus DSM 12809]|uniref:Uncharacterized protein n=1 Tax=Denitrovibrio acetiphilus (strain DSM 12809 / NBRC 114555 / N2460) TaxID=522772 RepID=D4H3R2_DENA2|nr:hypothetical protein [Denitrovibrio acetiphilus]ADD69164.1 conserved hypothetical protein [Denitrovibrio acetiphilus DSM 12809]